MAVSLADINRDFNIGLCLSGGVVRGFVHLGVLQVLVDEAGLEVDIVGGASSGAILGYCYAAGADLKQVHEFSEEMGWGNMARPVWPREGFLSFEPIERWLRNTLGDLHFEDLARPFVVMTTDLETGDQVTFDKGPVAPAVRASCSVPGLVEPVKINGRVLGDGGVAGNLPVAAARRMGADYVIGVDVFYPTYRHNIGPLGAGLAAIEIMVQRSGNGRNEADCLIAPNLHHKTFVNFHDREELMEIGRRATRQKLPEIRRELQTLAREHAPAV